MFDNLSKLAAGKPENLIFNEYVTVPEALSVAEDTMDYYICYILWLMEMTNASLSYSNLFNELMQIEFTWFEDTHELAMDENRHKDALRLRNEFFDECVPYDNIALELDDLIGGLHSTVLEMIVALSRRMEHHVSERNIVEIFWDILENLGIDEMDNDVLYYDVRTYESTETGELERVLVMSEDMEALYVCMEVLLNREYRKDGKGSMFPVKKKGYRINEMEIWRQANLYCQVKEG